MMIKASGENQTNNHKTMVVAVFLIEKVMFSLEGGVLIPCVLKLIAPISAAEKIISGNGRENRKNAKKDAPAIIQWSLCFKVFSNIFNNASITIMITVALIPIKMALTAVISP